MGERSVSVKLLKSWVSIQILFTAGINARKTPGWIWDREAQTPDSAMSLTEEVQKLRQQNREQAKEIARLKEENEFLAEASAFFAASRRR